MSLAARSRRRTGKQTPDGGGRQSLVGAGLGVCVLVALWAALSRSQPEIVLPSPGATWESLRALAADGTLVRELLRTLYRAASGVAIALVLGLAWGAVNGVSSWAAAVSRPAVSSLMAVPPVVFVALGLIWFGPGDTVTRLVVVLVALPLIVITVQEAVRNLDRDLVEMAVAFGLPRAAVVGHVVAPGIASPVLAATSVTFGQAVRVAVMAELLSSIDGIGAEVALARTNLATADLFAWTITLVAMVLLLEACLVRPVTARLLRWRGAAARGEAVAADHPSGTR